MNELSRTLAQMEIGGSEDKLKQFSEYRKQILAWNEKVNLTAITDSDEFERRHFVESLLAARHQGFQEATWVVDIGTGAGFPGIPLAICYPEKQFVLIDSLAKRMKIVAKAAAEANILNVRLVHGRAEDLAHLGEYRERFDAGLSRAVAKMATLVEYALPFIKPGGVFGAYKSSHAEEECREADKAIRLMGAKLETIETGGLLEEYATMPIYWFRKERRTPENYPRKAGTPSKNPIL